MTPDPWYYNKYFSSPLSFQVVPHEREEIEYTNRNILFKFNNLNT